MTSSYPISYQGRPVPWVTKWTGEEIHSQPFRIALLQTGPMLVRGYQPEPAERDSRNVMWMRDGAAGRGGEPMWRSVHAARHRRCMTKPCCQVCGKTVPADRTPWLLSRPEWQILTDGTDETTVTPPTCEDCWEAAERLCPHLRTNDTVRCYAVDWGLWGVLGDLYAPDRSAQQMVRVSFANPDQIAMTYAKQMVAHIRKLEPV